VVTPTRTDRYEGVPGYESWWDVPVAEISEVAGVQAARAAYESAKHRQRRPS
jgi:3D-(3,5/4)-trihydroxycyclohexane-1,2-dione acylhydrolase (decyclizing)